MHLVKKNGLQYWQFDLLSHGLKVTHGSFLRTGGVSPAPFASLNVAEESGDLKANVRQNIRLIQNALQVPHLVSTQQCHGTAIHLVKDPHSPIPPCDALITQATGIALLIKHADCQAAFFYDPMKCAIAIAHAGWRGLTEKVFTKTIAALKAHFGTRPENLLVCISPSLGPSHAEFIHYRTEFPASFFPFNIGSDHFDLWAIAEHELKEAGVLPHHLEIARQCTYSHPADYFSHRREKDKGRLASVLALV